MKYLILLTLFATNLVEQPAPEVRIEQGTVAGKVSKDGTFYEYVGIPYAVFDEQTMFQAPSAPPSWKGIFKATDEIYLCPQKSRFGLRGSLDCLRINVYVPVRARRPLPVMFYIHGGAFLLGNGGQLLYAPDFLVQYEVIVVTFNYRLGPLGFLCLGIPEAPGNAGLKDQLAALKWVRKNIAAFGGDPDNITIFGESAGGASVSFFLANEATEGLFQRAIVQSGSSLSNWAINREPLLTASLLAKHFGYNATKPEEIYEVLSKVSWEDLTLADIKKPLQDFFDTDLLYLPCIETNISGVEAFITDLPYNLLSRRRKRVPVIYGSNSKEGLFLISRENDQSIKQRNDLYMFSSDLTFPTKKEAESVSRKIKEFYFGKEDIGPSNVLSLSDKYTHHYFEIPAMLESELLITNSDTRVYNYYFDYDGSRNFLKIILGYRNESGACHGDDIMYLFKGWLWPFPISENDRKVIQWMCKMFTNFAKYSDPTPASDNELPVKWTPSNKENLEFLYINDELKMGSLPNARAYDLWRETYNKYRRKNLIEN